MKAKRKREQPESKLVRFAESHPDELRLLWYYEFSRELGLKPSLRRAVPPPWEFFRNLPGPLDWHGFRAWVEQVPEWPKWSYLDISARNRKRYLKLWLPGGRQVQQALLLRPQLPTNLDPAWLLKQLNDGFNRNGWPGFSWGGYGVQSEFLLIQLPYGASPTALKKAFAALLDRYPRNSKPLLKKKGQGSIPRQLKYDLKALEASRDEVQRLQLFPNSHQWAGAEARLAELFKWFPMTDPPGTSIRNQ